MAKSTQTTSAPTSAPTQAFQAYEGSLHDRMVALKKVDSRVKSLRGKAFGLEVHMDNDAKTGKYTFLQSGHAIDVARLYNEAKMHDDKATTRAMTTYYSSQRISEYRTYEDLVTSGQLEEVFNTTIKGTKTKEISSISYMLKVYKKAIAPAKEEATAEAETPDVGETAESQAEDQQETVKIPLNTEEDFVALMIERGLDLNKVVEIIFDLDKQSKVA